MTILEMSVSGAAMILTITLIRAVFINKLPKKAFVLMWEIVIFRLLIPLRIPSILSVFTISKQLFSYSKKPLNAVSETNADIIINGGNDQAQTIQDFFETPVWVFVQLGGAAVFIVIFIVLYANAFRRISTAERIDIDLPSSFKLHRNVEVRVCAGIFSPLTYGLLKPVILLPKALDINNREQLDLILTHELTHIKRFDILRKFAVIIAVCVHWSNPLAWVMFVLFNRDIELVCDDVTIGTIGRENRRKYALALVDLMDAENSSGMIGNHFSKNAVEERIASIAKYKKNGVISKIASVVITAWLIVFFAASAYDGAQKKLNEIGGYESIFDSPITRVVLNTNGDDPRSVITKGKPFIDRWNTFLQSAELCEINKNNLANPDTVVITTAEGEFTIYTDGETLTLGDKVYTFKSSIPIPIDAMLYPFGKENSGAVNSAAYDKEDNYGDQH